MHWSICLNPISASQTHQFHYLVDGRPADKYHVFSNIIIFQSLRVSYQLHGIWFLQTRTPCYVLKHTSIDQYMTNALLCSEHVPVQSAFGISQQRLATSCKYRGRRSPQQPHPTYTTCLPCQTCSPLAVDTDVRSLMSPAIGDTFSWP